MRCRWCGRNFAGVVPLCAPRCFALALWRWPCGAAGSTPNGYGRGRIAS